MGNLEEERVVCKVLADADVGRYLLGVGRYTVETNLSSNLSKVFWFPDKQVKAGDFIVLFTKSGTNREYANRSNSTTHAFHLGLDTVLWISPDMAAILFEAPEWNAKRAAD